MQSENTQPENIQSNSLPDNAYRELRPGDVVNIPAGVKHWHGAAKDSWFVHLAVEVPGENARNEWLEPVSETDYDRLP